MIQSTSRITMKHLTTATTNQMTLISKVETHSLQQKRAGLRHMVAESAKLSAPALQTKRSLTFFATQSADLATKALVQSAGSTALKTSVMMVLSAQSQHLTDVELAPSRSTKAMRDGGSFTTQSAKQTSTMLPAAFAHPTVR